MGKGVDSNQCMSVVPSSPSILQDLRRPLDNLHRFWMHNCLIMLWLLLLEQGYWYRRNSQKLLPFSVSQWWESARKVQCLDVDLSKSSFSFCANICLCVSDALTVNIFRYGGFYSTFSGWCSTRKWLRPEICCRISTLCSQCHLVSLWKHYQRNQVTMCLWEILNCTWLVRLLQPDTITKISVVARSCHTKPSFCQGLKLHPRC